MVLILSALCSTSVLAQRSFCAEKVPQNKMKLYEQLKAETLKSIENDKRFDSEMSRIKYAECSAFSKIMYEVYYHEMTENDKKKKRSLSARRTEKAVGYFLLIFARH